MTVGVVKEIKPDERRVALTPAGAHALGTARHVVLVERDAGAGAGFDDDAYRRAGALIVDRPQEVWERADLLLKVKEPIKLEYARLRTDQLLFTYLHLAADRPLTDALCASGVTAIGYETVQLADGRLPLLAPMSQVAGRMAAQVAAHHLLAPFGGTGVLMGGVPGVAPARVVILGGGVVGTHAARIAVGMGADVTILDRSVPRLEELEERFAATARVLMSDALTVDAVTAEADAVIGAALVPGALAPRLVTRAHLSTLRAGVVLVDVAIDQGGSFECSRPTTHADPTFVVDGVVHYCVANMPAAVPVTSTRALTNVTLPYVLRLATGLDEALASCPELALGVNVRDGRVINPEIAATHPDAGAPVGVAV